mmetsp:Transcript_1124/g.2035  ORF Transcript_1124/g.2035 Transcript_1124/m.2035 type:complete len:102 (+) Transcript_1124:327-632(+)
MTWNDIRQFTKESSAVEAQMSRLESSLDVTHRTSNVGRKVSEASSVLLGRNKSKQKISVVAGGDERNANTDSDDNPEEDFAKIYMMVSKRWRKSERRAGEI